MKNAFGKGVPLLAADWLQKSSPAMESVVAVVCAFLFASIFLVVINVSPWEVLVSLLRGALDGRHAVGTTLEETIPLFLSGVAFLLPFLVGFFNIGVQGQLQIGALFAVWVTLNMSGPPVVVITAAMLAAVLGGVVAVAIPLLAKVYLGVNEVVTTIMFNFICIFFTYAMVTGPMKDPAAWFGTTHPVPVSYRLPEIFPGLHVGFLIAVMLGVVGYVLLRHSSFGLRVRASGLNPTAAQEAGINTKRVMVESVLMSGAIAGLVGAMQALGVVHRVAEGWAKPWGFLGIVVGLLGGLDVSGALGAAFFLAILETGSRHMQAMTGVPGAFVPMLQGLPVVFVLAARAARAFSKLFPATEEGTAAALSAKEAGR